MDDSLDTWFKREVLPEERALANYFRRIWPRSSDIPDLVQETFARVYEAALTNRPLVARAFLLATARNLVIDRIRRDRIVTMESLPDLDESNVFPEQDELSPERHAIAWQDLRRLASAFDALPARCRDVVWMRRIAGLSHREVAQQLGISEKTVEKHVTKAAKLLAALMGSDQVAGDSRAASTGARPPADGTSKGTAKTMGSVAVQGRRES